MSSPIHNLSPLRSELQPAHVRASAASGDIPLERLTGAKNLTEAEKIEAVSQQFEALLLRQILGEAQKPMFKSALEGDSASDAIYRDLFTSHLADQIARSGSLGLAQMLQQQLSRPEPGTVPPAALR